MIGIAQTMGEGVYDYLWTKPETQGRGHRKLAFVKHFPKLNWFIGTGEYLEDAEADLKESNSASDGGSRFGDNGYIFAGTLGGISLVGPAKGQNMSDIVDANGVKIVRELIRTAKSGGGFVEYTMPAFPGYSTHRKLSYVTIIPDLGLVHGCWGQCGGRGKSVSPGGASASGRTCVSGPWPWVSCFPWFWPDSTPWPGGPESG